MSSIGRLKRSCLCAAVAVIASALGDFTLGLIANQPNAGNFDRGDLFVDFVGIFLAPGWLLFRRTFERARPSQFPGLVLLVLVVSFLADAGLIFAVWEIVRRSTNRMRLSS